MWDVLTKKKYDPLKYPWVLNYLDDKRSSGIFLCNWVLDNKDDLSFDDLLLLLKCGSKISDLDRKDMVEYWLGGENASVETLPFNKIMSTISDIKIHPDVKSRWLKKKYRAVVEKLSSSAESSSLSIPESLDLDDDNLLDKWTGHNNDNLSYAQIKFIYQLFEPDPEFKVLFSAIFQRWIKNSTHDSVKSLTFEELQDIGLNAGLKEEELQDWQKIFKEWFEKKDIKFQMSFFCTPQLKALYAADGDQNSFFKSWVKGRGSNLSFDNVLFLCEQRDVTIITNHMFQEFFIDWLKLSGCDDAKNLSLEQLRLIIANLDEEDGVVIEWLLKQDNLERALELNLFKEPRNRTSFIILWTERQASNLSCEDLSSLSKKLDSDSRRLVLRNILKSSLHESFKSLSRKELESIFDPVKSSESQIIALWLRVDSYARMALPENKKLLLSLKEESGYEKLSFLKDWIKKATYKVSFDDLKPFLQGLPIDNHIKVVQIWLENKNNTITFEESQAILSSLPEGELRDAYRKSFIEAHFYKNPISPATFVEEIKKMHDVHYDTSLMALCVQHCKPNMAQLIEIANSLYPELEASKVDFLVDCAKSKIITKEIFVENFSLFKDFVASIQNQELILHFFEELLQNEISLSELQILKIVEGRLRRRYIFLAEVIDKISFDEGGNPIYLSKLLTAEGLQNITNLFGDAEEKISLSELFAYYVFRGEIANLVGHLSAEVKSKIQDNFKLPDDMAYLTQLEYQEMQSLLEGRINMSEAASLCSYLQSKVAIPEFILNEDSYQINFTDSNLASAILEYERLKAQSKTPETDKTVARPRSPSPELAKQTEVAYKAAEEEQKKNAELNAKFINLLKLPNPTAEEVMNGFGVLFDAEFVNLLSENLSERGKFCEFFNQNKNKIANLLSQKDGLMKLSSCLGALKDGCVHNITTQFNMILYDQYIHSVSDKMVYLLFLRTVVQDLSVRQNVPIFDDVVESPLQKELIRECRIYPRGFFTALRREFTMNESQETKQIKTHCSF